MYEFINHNSFLILLIFILVILIAGYIKNRSNIFLVAIPVVALFGFLAISVVSPAESSENIKTSGFLSQDQPTIVEFMSPTCMACLVSKPTVSAMKDLYGDKVKFVEIDVTKQEFKDDAREYGVSSTPTFVMFNADGEEKYRFSGIAKSRIMDPEIKKLIQQ
jgi:thiol-disulfide isomerase/thioredoxin|tara:strand:+ start:1098 stop:1583 length:486 start_codon:yes stop_codon:yes gene_type:complete